MTCFGFNFVFVILFVFLLLSYRAVLLFEMIVKPNFFSIDKVMLIAVHI